ncbi:MAG TPA: VOC family protein [Steroidobacteraceae bacterium]|jgi:catechol 2,3-dioxygenase-like lactoylglutathione lyase family enzyme|nr:VOC family protein [Steroidobacteraceae bacterium]
MQVNSCLPIIPSADLERSLRFWVDGLGLTVEREMREAGRLVGCMVQNERLAFWLNRRASSSAKPDGYEGIRLYWAPEDLPSMRARLQQLGYPVSSIANRDYGQSEFFVTDDDGHSHCFGIATSRANG